MSQLKPTVVKTFRDPELDAVRAILAVRWGRPVGQREGVDAAILIAYDQLCNGFEPAADLLDTVSRKTGRPAKDATDAAT